MHFHNTFHVSTIQQEVTLRTQGHPDEPENKSQCDQDKREIVDLKSPPPPPPPCLPADEMIYSSSSMIYLISSDRSRSSQISHEVDQDLFLCLSSPPSPQMTCRFWPSLLGWEVSRCETCSHSPSLQNGHHFYICKTADELLFVEQKKKFHKWHHCFHKPRALNCMGRNLQDAIKKAERYEKKRKTDKHGMQHLPSDSRVWEAFDCRACVCE